MTVADKVIQRVVVVVVFKVIETVVTEFIRDLMTSS